MNSEIVNLAAQEANPIAREWLEGEAWRVLEEDV